MYDFYVFFPGLVAWVQSLSGQLHLTFPKSPAGLQPPGVHTAGASTGTSTCGWLVGCSAPVKNVSFLETFAICHEQIPFWHPNCHMATGEYVRSAGSMASQYCQYGFLVMAQAAVSFLRFVSEWQFNLICHRPFFLAGPTAGPTGLMELFKQVDQWRKIRPNEESTESTQKNISHCFLVEGTTMYTCIPRLRQLARWETAAGPREQFIHPLCRKSHDVMTFRCNESYLETVVNDKQFPLPFRDCMTATLEVCVANLLQDTMDNASMSGS